ncbi:putative nucleoside transporter-like [Trypanosoma grayi]|uniref:putative nucleoside transporter-like n=1 Tax=Trypanosoma grayi TaxID=71804 RepID=UPI0004F4BC37|nr:putative nucleoside transporter-like [Trypanosoma grayi]KEG07196.1 putative nucleoside transporter-like [Trypanosoma grayi]
MAFFSCFGECWTFITSLVMGVTMVIGVSAVTSAPSYMLDYYKYVAGDEGTEPKNEKFWETVLTFYTVVTMVTQTIFEPVNLTTFCCRLSLRFRLLASGVLMLLELLVILLLPTSSGVSEEGAMAAVLLMAFVGGIGRVFYENTGYALFGPCPPTMGDDDIGAEEEAGCPKRRCRAPLQNRFVSGHIYKEVGCRVCPKAYLMLWISPMEPFKEVLWTMRPPLRRWSVEAPLKASERRSCLRRRNAGQPSRQFTLHKFQLISTRSSRAFLVL